MLVVRTNKNVSLVNMINSLNQEQGCMYWIRIKKLLLSLKVLELIATKIWKVVNMQLMLPCWKSSWILKIHYLITWLVIITRVSLITSQKVLPVEPIHQNRKLLKCHWSIKFKIELMKFIKINNCPKSTLSIQGNSVTCKPESRCKNTLPKPVSKLLKTNVILR